MTDEDETERARRLVEDDGFVTVYPAVATLSGVVRHGIFSETRLMQELPEDNSKAVASLPDMSESFSIQGHVQMFGRLYIEDGVVKFDGDVDATAQVLFDTLLPMVQEVIDQSDLRARAEKAEAEVARLREALEIGIALIKGDSFGLEWKRGCSEFIKCARAALKGDGE